MNSVLRFRRAQTVPAWSVVAALAAFLLVAVMVPLIPSAFAQVGATCGPDGALVTVDLSLGQVPTDGPDVILGTDGDDLIAAGAGDDVICAGDGDDKVWGQSGDDFIAGESGDDTLRGGPGNDLLFGGVNADNLAGGSGDDAIWGGPGSDPLVRGGTGDDILDGGAGDDPLVAGNGGEDAVNGGFGDDKVTGGPRADYLDGWWGDDELRGNKGVDFMVGGFGDDELFGGPQADDMLGWAGNDTCNGGTTGDGAPENDEAHCETVINVEDGQSVVLAGSVNPIPRLVGEANYGGPLADLTFIGGATGFSLVSPQELDMYIWVRPGCDVVDATVTSTSNGSAEVILWRGPTQFPIPDCGFPQPTTLRIELSEPVTSILLNETGPQQLQAAGAAAARFGSFITN